MSDKRKPFTAIASRLHRLCPRLTARLMAAGFAALFFSNLLLMATQPVYAAIENSLLSVDYISTQPVTFEYKVFDSGRRLGISARNSADPELAWAWKANDAGNGFGPYTIELQPVKSNGANPAANDPDGPFSQLNTGIILITPTSENNINALWQGSGGEVEIEPSNLSAAVSFLRNDEDGGADDTETEDPNPDADPTPTGEDPPEDEPEDDCDFSEWNFSGTGQGLPIIGGLVAAYQNKDALLNRITNPLDWFGCAVINGLGSFNEKVQEVIGNWLKLDVNQSNENSLRRAWSGFLTIANILFVIAFLIMVISTALNLGVFDAYTVKKLLPRIIIAAILANLSFAICMIIISLTNAIGDEIPIVINSLTPNNAPTNVAGVAGISGGLIALGSIAALAMVGTAGVVAALPAMLAVAIAAVIAVAVVAIRQVIIILLVVLAPIAFTLWVLPGGENLFKRWWKLFIQLLFMYPIMMALFSAGAFTAVLVGQQTESEPSVVSGMMMIAVTAAPLLLLPAVFKMSSGVLGTLASTINGSTKGLRKGTKDYRRKKMGEGWESIKSGKRFKQPKGANSIRGRLNRGLQTASIVGTGKAGLRPSKMRAELAATRTSQNFQAAREMLEKDETMQLFKKDDDKLHALVHGTDEASVRRILQASAPGRFAGAQNIGALDQATAEVMRVKKNHGTQAARMAGVMANGGTGTAWNTAGEMLDDINFAAGDDRTAAGLMLAEIKGAAMQSGRVDLGGAGFAHMQVVMDRRRAAMAGGPAFSTQDATESVRANVWESQGGATLVHSSMKQGAVEQMGEQMILETRNAWATGDDDALVQNLASLSAVHDGLKGSSPQKARWIADHVMAQEIDIAALSPEMKQRLAPALLQTQADGSVSSRSAGTITYQQAMEGLRGDQRWQEMNREYQRQVDAVQAQQGQQGQGPPGAPPGAPGANPVGPP